MNKCFITSYLPSCGVGTSGMKPTIPVWFHQTQVERSIAASLHLSGAKMCVMFRRWVNECMTLQIWKHIFDASESGQNIFLTELVNSLQFACTDTHGSSDNNHVQKCSESTSRNTAADSVVHPFRFFILHQWVSQTCWLQMALEAVSLKTWILSHFCRATGILRSTVEFSSARAPRRAMSCSPNQMTQKETWIQKQNHVSPIDAQERSEKGSMCGKMKFHHLIRVDQILITLKYSTKSTNQNLKYSRLWLQRVTQPVTSLFGSVAF